jgi:hypothetical protein
MTESTTTDFTERRRPLTWLSRPRRIVILYVIAFVISEAVGVWVNLTTQAIADALLAFLAVNTAIFAYRTQRTVGVVMSALFTMRLVTIALPMNDISLPTRAALIGLLSCIVSYLATWVLGRDVESGRADEGFRLARSFLPRRSLIWLTVAAGVPLGVIAYEILQPRPLAIDAVANSTTLPILAAMIGLSIGATGEELLYRRVVAVMVHHTAQSRTPFISGILWAATYLAFEDWRMVVFAFVTGSAFSWTCERTGTVKPVIAAHAIASIAVYVALPT